MINLTFPDLHEDIGVDKYRIFSIEKHQSNFVIFAAYYAEEGDIDDNIGKTLLISFRWFECFLLMDHLMGTEGIFFQQKKSLMSMAWSNYVH